MDFTPRPKQEEVLRYRRGRMGVSAVPGSGKTHVLSRLASDIIARGELEEDQEVLIVTLVNSAVNNFESRIKKFLEGRVPLSYGLYRVRTLHGLAHDIVRERPALVGLSPDFQIIDERAAAQIISDAARSYLHSHPRALDDYVNPALDEGYRDWLRRDKLPELLIGLSGSFIRTAKDQGLLPEDVRRRLEELPVPLPLADMATTIYADYQRSLAYRAAVDFDDLIRLALLTLQGDAQFLERMRFRWPYILEDEAQDSSRLQEEVLRLLVGPAGNWVRVGDPNQAIFETFTTASPEYLKKFIQQPDVEARQLPNSGRSAPPVIELANHLIEWTMSAHPATYARQALVTPYIELTPEGDPQPNPPAAASRIHLESRAFDPNEEIRQVADSLAHWLPENPDLTCAVLVPRNQRGYELSAELERRKIAYVDQLKSTTQTRLAAGVLGNVLSYLSDPCSPSRLARLFQVWRRDWRETEAGLARLEHMAKLLSRCSRVEEFIWPRVERDWLAAIDLPEGEVGEAACQELVEFREQVRRWQGAALLPVDQAVLTVAQDLFSEPTDLAMAHKLALVLRQASDVHTHWRLPELTAELAAVAKNERRFLGFSDDDTGFDPDRYRGQVLITTMHKAKGLEWDRVYLMSVNNYDFPSGQPNDTYISERYFVRNSLNLEAEAIEQLRQAMSHDPYAWYEEGAATQQARLEYVSERLRLLYVGITRARRELIITYNSGRKSDMIAALPLQELIRYWKEEM